MRLFDIFNQGFDDIVVNLQQCYSSLYKNQQDVLEKKKEYTQNLNTYFRNKEYFSKSATGKSILENIETKFQVYQEGFFDFLKKQEKEQDKIQKSISRIYKSNPDLIYLSEYKQFITENKFYELMVTLTKGHQNKLVEKSRLLDLNKFKRIDLKKGSVYVKDFRTHYSDCIVINEFNEILLLKRNNVDNFESAKYCLPGGYIEDGEDFEYAALRKLQEETGIKASQGIPSGDYVDNKTVIHYFTVKVKKDECNIFLEEREHQQYEWVPLSKINEYPLLKNLKDNFEEVILIPSCVINPTVSPNVFIYYNDGNFVKAEETEILALADNLYKDFKKGGDLSSFENFIKENKLDLQTYAIYNLFPEPIYGIKLNNNIEKSHKYIKREGVSGNYKYTYPEDLKGKRGNLKEEPLKSGSIIEEVERTIPNDFKTKVKEFLDDPSKMVRFKMEDVEVFIYNTKINKTPTSTPIFPKNIYLNLDYLSDVPKVILGESSIIIDMYYAYLHELDHIKTRIPPAATPDNWEVYINSPAEKSAMEASDKWLREASKKAFLQKSEKIEGGLADNKTLQDIAEHHNVSIDIIEDEFHRGKKVEMEHTDKEDVAEEIAKDHLWEIPDYYTRLKEMEKEAKEDDFEKGKKAEIGEIREWSGVKMQKTAQGWLPVKKDSPMSKEENGGKMSSVEKQEQKKEYSEKELEEFARKTSESDLKQAASGEDEQLRIVAKKELERRKVEENPAKKDEPVKETKENKDTVLHKKKQLEIILNSNPSLDEIHTWIRKEEDIKTAEEAFNESIESDESAPDFKKEDMENALKEGSVIIYSSYPIKDGVFVTPSKMEAQSYAGKKDVFSKKVKLDDIAWIDGLQGQFAPIKEIGEVSKKKGNDKE